eukprot:CAMPEP_0119120010 /NCGR_PEP_ID=MMETSP1310-20130426/1250_1 /TAXON_ID=464262 /ORGANISM="Genus nov. species nov., Strain RCC2339" /LENGTH=170 /DNA_ID=CAMNT_0007109473 /DNA_START=93 /DNA_END=605 /DNA_ORIENTATION=-
MTEAARLGVNALSLENAAFRFYCLAVGALVVKQIATNVNAGLQKLFNKVVGSPEDAIFVENMPKHKTKGFGTAHEHPAVQRAYRMIQNDHENLYIFYILALLFVVVGASPLAAQSYFGLYVVSRYVHTIAYAGGAQPHRAIAFFAGLVVLLALVYHIVSAAFRLEDFQLA